MVITTLLRSMQFCSDALFSFRRKKTSGDRFSEFRFVQFDLNAEANLLIIARLPSESNQKVLGLIRDTLLLSICLLMDFMSAH